MFTLSSAELFFLTLAVQQGVLALGWWLVAALMPSARRAAASWGMYGAVSALALLFYVLAVQSHDERARVAGGFVVVLAMVALQRGVRYFFGLPMPWRWHGAVVLVALAGAWFGLSPEDRALRVMVNSALLAGLNFATAWDVQRFAAPAMPRRWGWVLASPLLVGGLLFVLRGLRAAWWPNAPMLADVTSTNVLHLGSAFAYQSVSLVFQLMLVALLVSRLINEQRRMARNDPLTGLLNRRAIDEMLEDEAQRARRLGAPFTVLMIDADHFKRINDRLGHAAGDRALQHLAAVLSAQLREIDRVGRYGGEEFVLVLPGTTSAQALVLAERLRERVAALPPMWRGNPVALTVSMGLADWHATDTGPSQMLSRADAALYRAKGTGRNRIVCAPEFSDSADSTLERA